ncbi:hypothetical protein [Tsukamurella tyrosinosolvens]|uniref:hypothetical protein n=1 Tax=Tsukamurella tyrosinosolvens TaxID=57704 RepID=UPI0011462492|nr:hypothetical protein [Tsukamurella tyrosinosolvens]
MLPVSRRLGSTGGSTSPARGPWKQLGKPPTCGDVVRLRAVGSNPPRALQRLLTHQASERTPSPDQPRPPRQYRKPEPDEVDAIAAAYLTGSTLAELSKQHGLHVQTIKAHLRRANTQLRPAIKVTPAITAHAVQLYKAGHSTIEISQRFGVSDNAIAAALRRQGVILRPRGGRRAR